LTGIDDIPGLAVKKCLKFLKKPLTDICNTLSESGIFPNKLKHAKATPLYKNETQRISKITDLYSSYQSFKKF
jgi:hypothetical protein